MLRLDVVVVASILFVAEQKNKDLGFLTHKTDLIDSCTLDDPLICPAFKFFLLASKSTGLSSSLLL